VAIDAATGRRLWAQPGAGLRCGRLTFTVDHPVRCRATGRLDLGYAPGTSLLQNVNVTLEGFDPATGATRWSWRAGAVRGLVLNEEHDESVIQVSDTTYLIRSETSGLTLLDLDSGPHPVQGPPPTGWCRGSVKLPRPVAEETSDLRYWPCDSEAKPVEMPGNVPHFAGTRSGDVFAWAERNRVQAVFID
jgi:hypothetical protein